MSKAILICGKEIEIKLSEVCVKNLVFVGIKGGIVVGIAEEEGWIYIWQKNPQGVYRNTGRISFILKENGSIFLDCSSSPKDSHQRELGTDILVQQFCEHISGSINNSCIRQNQIRLFVFPPKEE